jgi:hypothetical protein
VGRRLVVLVPAPPDTNQHTSTGEHEDPAPVYTEPHRSIPIPSHGYEVRMTRPDAPDLGRGGGRCLGQRRPARRCHCRGRGGLGGGRLLWLPDDLLHLHLLVCTRGIAWWMGETRQGHTRNE